MIDLYRFYDAKGKLLYIGISLHAAIRASTHRHSDWWVLVERMGVEHMQCSRDEALDRERLAIMAERPRYNTAHRGAVKRPPPNPDVALCPDCHERAVAPYRKSCFT